MERRQLGKVRPRVGGSPVGRGSGVDEEDFLKDKRSPSLGDMLNMYLFSSPARKAVIALIVVVLVGVFASSSSKPDSAPATVPVRAAASVPSLSAVHDKVADAKPDRGDEAALEGGKHEAALEVHQAEEPEHQAEEPEHQAEEPAEEERPKTAVEEPDHHDTPVHEAENAEEPQQQAAEQDPDQEPQPQHELEQEREASAGELAAGDPAHAKRRWAALEIPSSCLLPGVLPTGVVGGLELYSDIPEDPPPPAPMDEEEPARESAQEEQLPPEDTAASHQQEDVVEPETLESAADETPVHVQDEVEEETRVATRETAEPEDPPVDATEEPVEERVALSTEAENNPEVEPEDGVQEGGRITVQDPDVDGQEDTAQLDEAQEAERRRGARRLLVRKEASSSTSKATVPMRTSAFSPLKVGRGSAGDVHLDPTAGAVRMPNLLSQRHVPVDVNRGTYNALLNWQPSSSTYGRTEIAIMNLLRNTTSYEAHCQYSSRECAKESARELANLLRLNAQAVSDAEGGSYEMQRVATSLQALRTNTRMTLNQTVFPQS